MRTTNTFQLVLLLALAGAAPALAQPTDADRAEAAMRVEIKRLLDEYARFAEDATGFEGVWRLSGVRKLKKNGETKEDNYTGEVTLTRGDDGEFKGVGTLYLEGRTTGKLEVSGAPTSTNKTFNGTYKATIGGEGELTLRVADGGLAMSWKGKVAGSDVSGAGDAVRALGMTKAQLEAKLFELSADLQASRYPRPTPVRYRTPSRKTELRFTPTVEWDPQGVEQQVVDLIDAARVSIELAVFEFSLMRVAEALVRAQERGVKVRMVYDNREDEQPAIHHIKAHDVPARSDGRSGYMHNKFIVVDKRIVWTGSTNLAPGGIYIADNNAISFKHPGLAAIYTTEFEEMFTDGKFGPTSPRNTSNAWMSVDTGLKAQVFFAPEDNAMDRVIEVVKGAKKSIKFIAFAYTSKSLFAAMKERIDAGVKVEGIFESRHAGWADIKIGPLHAAGAKVRFDENPNALHHKVIIVDDRYVCTGSFNFSDGADRSNDENLLVLDNLALANAFAREFESLMSVTDPNDPRIATSGMGGGSGGSVTESVEELGDGQ